MRSTLHQHLERLETHNADLCLYVVWWDVHGGKPYPKAEPGEWLVIIRWMVPKRRRTRAKAERPLGGRFKDTAPLLGDSRRAEEQWRARGK